jgi:hypothetical protein
VAGKLRNRDEWKKLLRTARNRRILHIPMEWMNEWMNECTCMKHIFKITNKLNRQPNNLVVPKSRHLVFVFWTWRPAFYSSLHSFIVRAMETACVTGRIPQIIATHLKNRKKVTKQWTHKSYSMQQITFFYEPVFASVANNCWLCIETTGSVPLLCSEMVEFNAYSHDIA